LEVSFVMADLTIAVDTNEQKPHHYLEGAEVSKDTTVRYTSAKLDTFDYCVAGDWEEWEGHKTKFVRFSIERKSVADFIGSWFSAEGSRRERAKIKRAREAWGDKLPIIYVIEGDHTEIGAYNYSRFPSGRVDAKAVHAKISDLRFAGVQVILCRNRHVAEYEIVSLLKRRWRKVRFKQKTKGGCNGGKQIQIQGVGHGDA
jgi:ERCC4-type nuclease